MVSERDVNYVVPGSEGFESNFGNSHKKINSPPNIGRTAFLVYKAMEHNSPAVCERESVPIVKLSKEDLQNFALNEFKSEDEQTTKTIKTNCTVAWKCLHNLIMDLTEPKKSEDMKRKKLLMANIMNSLEADRHFALNEEGDLKWVSLDFIDRMVKEFRKIEAESKKAIEASDILGTGFGHTMFGLIERILNAIKNEMSRLNVSVVYVD